MNRGERAGVREPRDLARYDLWKKYVIGTRTKFVALRAEDTGGVEYGGQHYFFEEATWPKEDGSPKIVAQAQPDFGTIDDEGVYLWSVEWDFGDGPWRDHGKIEGRDRAKAKCLQIVADGSKGAYSRRQADRDVIASAQQEAWPEFEPDVDDGAEWRKPLKPKKRAARSKKTATVISDDIPEG